MKLIQSLALSTLLVCPAWAKKHLNPTDYPAKAHVNSAIFTHTTAPSNSRVTELQIGNLVYVSNRICREAHVGTTYPARVEGRWIYLLVDPQKECKYRVDGTKEAH